MGMKGRITLSAVVGLVVIGTVSANAGNHRPLGSGPTIRGDGSYQVGRDIQPGTYRTTGNTDGRCHWERDKDALHTPGSVLASGRVTGSAVVTISSGDAYFRTSGCKDWTKTP